MLSRLSAEEIAELKAHHLACSHLVKGCQDATIKLRRDRAVQLIAHPHDSVEYRAVEILEHVLGAWCETISIIRASLNQSSSGEVAVWQKPAPWPSVFSDERAGKQAQPADRRGM